MSHGVSTSSLILCFRLTLAVLLEETDGSERVTRFYRSELMLVKM